MTQPEGNQHWPPTPGIPGGSGSWPGANPSGQGGPILPPSGQPRAAAPGSYPPVPGQHPPPQGPVPMPLSPGVAPAGPQGSLPAGNSRPSSKWARFARFVSWVLQACAIVVLVLMLAVPIAIATSSSSQPSSSASRSSGTSSSSASSGPFDNSDGVYPSYGSSGASASDSSSILPNPGTGLSVLGMLAYVVGGVATAATLSTAGLVARYVARTIR